MYYTHKTPGIIQWLFPSLLWHKDRKEKNVYLTFDDGPIPGLTPAILDILREFNAGATFFCVGDNIRKHPDIFSKVIDEGHSVGNHTMHHMDGWRIGNHEYLADINQCSEYIRNAENRKKLFRPPYGKLTFSQIRRLRDDYEIVMWDVLSGDFDRSLNPDQCFERTIKHVRPGSIIVFHDNLKAESRVLSVLPRLLEVLREREWKCLSLH